MNIISYFEEVFGEYDLYQPQIDRFFRDRCTLRQDIASGENLTRKWGATGQAAVNYIASGYFKLYLKPPGSAPRFAGFMPAWSTLFDSRGGAVRMGKTLVAATGATLLSTSTSVYLQFLREAGDQVLQHQLAEAYWRRNRNIFAQFISDGQDATGRAATFVLCSALAVGRRLEDGATAIDGGLSISDIASYCGMHPNTASKCLQTLEREGLIRRSPQILIVPDLAALDAAIPAK